MRRKEYSIISATVFCVIFLCCMVGCKGKGPRPAPSQDEKLSSSTMVLPPSDSAVEPQPEAQPKTSDTPNEQPAPAVPETAPATPESPAPLTSPGQQVPFTPSVVKAGADVNIIVDASGSQNAFLGDNPSSKLDIQKKALFDIIPSFKQADFSRRIGIRIFGSQKALDLHDCSDTIQIYPMEQPDLEQIQKVLTPLSAMGESPLAVALEAAAKDLPQSSGDQIIILIADGADTCGADPCQVAKTIHAANPRTMIHVVGFDLTQEDEQKLRCIATDSEGKFYLARNENELRKSLDEAASSAIPYNLRLSAVVGATPIPTKITILKGSTEQVVKSETSFGTKLISLLPGTYDVMVEYASSPEQKKPSKVIKGVDILENTKIEQEINFDLGTINLSSIGVDGKISAANYEIQRAGTSEVFAGAEGIANQPTTLFLTPGVYDIRAMVKDPLSETTPLLESGIEVKKGESIDLSFRFQKGTLSIKGVTTQTRQIPFIFQIYKTETPEQVFASGVFGMEGGQLPLPPGTYDLVLIGQDPTMPANPRTRISAVAIKAGELSDISATFEMGQLKLSAVDGQNNPVRAEFDIRLLPSIETIAKVQMVDEKTPLSLAVPVGKYDIVASKISLLESRPIAIEPNIDVTSTTPVEKVFKFIFGTARIRGRNSKEQPINTLITLYRGGTSDAIATAGPTGDWFAFELQPGVYDAKAEDVSSEGEPKPHLWIKDIKVEDGKQVSHEAIFTAGKLKIIGRGANNKIITCNFKVFKYGSDRELINGNTGDDWQIFEIQPGNYYLEAAYTDPEASVLLKKWINIKVSENEVLELVLNF